MISKLPVEVPDGTCLERDGRISWPAVVGGISGLTIMALGLVLTRDSLCSRADRIWPEAGLLSLFGPMLFLAGIVVVIRCLLHLRTRAGCARHQGKGRLVCLAIGMILLCVGGFPWLYTPWLTGDRPGGESSGMLGTLIFFYVGLPGIGLTAMAGFWMLVVKVMKQEPNLSSADNPDEQTDADPDSAKGVTHGEVVSTPCHGLMRFYLSAYVGLIAVDSAVLGFIATWALWLLTRSQIAVGELLLGFAVATLAAQTRIDIRLAGWQVGAWWWLRVPCWLGATIGSAVLAMMSLGWLDNIGLERLFDRIGIPLFPVASLLASLTGVLAGAVTATLLRWCRGRRGQPVGSESIAAPPLASLLRTRAWRFRLACVLVFGCAWMGAWLNDGLAWFNEAHWPATERFLPAGLMLAAVSAQVCFDLRVGGRRAGLWRTFRVIAWLLLAFAVFMAGTVWSDELRRFSSKLMLNRFGKFLLASLAGAACGLISGWLLWRRPRPANPQAGAATDDNA